MRLCNVSFFSGFRSWYPQVHMSFVNGPKKLNRWIKQLELTMSNTLQQMDNTTIRLSVLVALVTWNNFINVVCWKCKKLLFSLSFSYIPFLEGIATVEMNAFVVMCISSSSSGCWMFVYLEEIFTFSILDSAISISEDKVFRSYVLD